MLSPSPSMTVPKHIHIGVFIPKTVQLLDLSPIDLFGMISPEYLRACQLPEPLIALGIPSTIHYISVPESGTHVELTASASLRVTKTINDIEVQPGKLNIILVPGPDPAAVFEEPTLRFLREHASSKGPDEKKVDILSVCTGANLLGQSGLLKGKKASGPRALIPMLRKKFPEVEWNDSKRWVQDGNVWTSGKSCNVPVPLLLADIGEGGITNGQEMVAAYMRQSFPGPATEAVIAMADVGDKGIDYANGKTAENVWWLWQILKAALIGSRKRKDV
jgi:putative intracellular protease/amidase